MGCGASEIVPPVEDLKDGEILVTLKELKMFEAPDGKKKVAEFPGGKPMKVISAEVTEGPGFTGFIKAECHGVQGYIALWQCELKTPPGGGTPVKGPKNGFMKRREGTGSDGLAKAAPAGAAVKEEAMGA